MPVHDQLLGSTQTVLSISLQPGESVIGPARQFAWMTDAIQLAAGQPGLSTYTAKDAAGTIAFAARQPGRIVSVEVAPEHAYLVHTQAFLAGTPGVEVAVVAARPGGARRSGRDLGLRCMRGHGRAWVVLAGDAVRHDLAAGASLRAQPWHIGMSDATVTLQLAELPCPAGGAPAGGPDQVAVLSGPGSVWLQSMAVSAAEWRRLQQEVMAG